jgi:hypothetical protein
MPLRLPLTNPELMRRAAEAEVILVDIEHIGLALGARGFSESEVLGALCAQAEFMKDEDVFRHLPLPEPVTEGDDLLWDETFERWLDVLAERGPFGFVACATTTVTDVTKGRSQPRHTFYGETLDELVLKAADWARKMHGQAPESGGD